MWLIIKLMIDILCGVLNSLGGYIWIPARRFIMPVIIGIGISVTSGHWWLGFTCLPVMGSLCLGYFGKKFWGRGLWLGIQALVIGCGSIITQHLIWYFYISYIIGAFLLGGFLYDLEQIIGDIIFGCWLGLIVFIIH